MSRLGEASRRYVRGSGMLLAGRCFALLLNFVVQVVLVRYLAKSEYGAFAYGLAAVTLLSSLILCGLGKALPRVVTVYQEQKDPARAFGSIVLAAGTVIGLGVAVISLLEAAPELVARIGRIDPAAMPVLLILIALAPLEAMDHLLLHLAAIFVGPRAILLRRHVFTPSMKLVAVGIVIVVGGGISELAYGYIAGTAVGITVYLFLLLRQWQRLGLLRYFRPSQLHLPVRELFGFGLPLASSDILAAVRGSLAVLLLGAFGTLHDVAEYRAVLPVAGLNMVVAETFGLMFVPVASRLFARDDTRGMNHLYWQNSVWVAVLTLPIFIVTCALSGTLVSQLFGAEYVAASPVLAILSIGYYFNAAIGSNAAMLRVTGRLRTIVINDVLAVVACVAVTAALVGPFGAAGAAAGTTATFIVHNLLNYRGLTRRRGGMLTVQRSVARVYAAIGATAAVLAYVIWAWSLGPLSAALIGSVLSIAVVRVSRDALNFDVTFPELLRVPVIGWFVR